MSALAIDRLSKRFGAVRALDEIELTVGEGEFFVILGPTNAGKSTLLKSVAGLLRPDAGTISIKGRRVDGLQPRERNVSLLFQNIALFPTMTGYENLAFPLRSTGCAAGEVDRRVHEIAALLRLEHLLDRHPRTFSGGERQRVAIGRAIVRPGDLLMLDEPLTNLDARLRIALRLEFKRLHRVGRQTVLYVTHDQVEAMSLADRIGILHHGRFQQIGTPAAIYQRPVNEVVARFVGAQSMNLLTAELATGDGGPELRGTGFRVAPLWLRDVDRARLPRGLAIGVRAEEIAVAIEPSPQAPFAARTVWIEHLGAKRVLDLRLGDARVKATVPRDHPVRPDETVWIGFNPQPHRLLDTGTGRFLQAPGERH